MLGEEVVGAIFCYSRREWALATIRRSDMRYFGAHSVPLGDDCSENEHAFRIATVLTFPFGYGLPAS